MVRPVRCVTVPRVARTSSIAKLQVKLLGVIRCEGSHNSEYKPFEIYQLNPDDVGAADQLRTLLRSVKVNHEMDRQERDET